ncbi:MAG TPA: hypothetical protein ENN09_07470 [Planctomycetes bacterium]|nr:hypothetical protein [Planctomycetota bacterium]
MTGHQISRRRAAEILGKAPALTVVVTGDVCLDAYWRVDMRLSELSRETPHYMKPVVAETYSPGAGGNVAVSLKTLGAGAVRVATVLGSDWRGRLLLDILRGAGIDCSGTLLSEQWTTTAFIKPMLRGYEERALQEDARLDFVNAREASEALVDAWLASLQNAVSGAHAVIVMDQVAPNLVTKNAANRLVELSKRFPGTQFVADSRYKPEAFAGMLLKGNDIEIVRAADTLGLKPADAVSAAAALNAKLACPVVMTTGEKGAVVANDTAPPETVPARPVSGEIDICGAGDAFTAAFVLALAADASPAEAAALGNASARFAVQQLGRTGNPAPDDLLAQIPG